MYIYVYNFYYFYIYVSLYKTFWKIKSFIWSVYKYRVKSYNQGMRYHGYLNCFRIFIEKIKQFFIIFSDTRQQNNSRIHFGCKTSIGFINLTCNFYFGVFFSPISVIKTTSFRFVQLLQPTCITPVAYSLLTTVSELNSTATSTTILAAIGAGSSYRSERNNRAARSTSLAITRTESRESGSKNEKSSTLVDFQHCLQE